MKRQSHGISLIEVLASVTVSSIVVSITAVALHGLYGVERASRARSEQRANAARLATIFRDDCHRALSAQTTPRAGGQAAVLKLQLPGARVVRFTADGGNVQRTATVDGQIRHRDRFPLGRDARVFWTVDEQSGWPFVTTRIEHRPVAGDQFGPASTESWVARIGRWPTEASVNE